MQISSAAPRVIRGWLAASVCTWSAFAAHAQATPTAASAVALLLITCVSAVIAMVFLGRKFNLFTTSLVVLLSQSLYHLSMSVMSHPGSALQVNSGSGVHAQHVTGLSVTDAVAASEPNSMLLAHLLAAVVSIFILRQGQKIATALAEVLSLATVRRILAILRTHLPALPRVARIEGQQHSMLSQTTALLPLLRGPPSTVLISS